MRATFVMAASAIGLILPGPVAEAQESFTVEAHSEALPEELSPSIREALDEQGARVLDDQGKPVLDLWLRKGIQTKEPISGPTGSVLLPFLDAGQLVGAIRLAGEAGDYKDQSILPGVYTMRYGLQPVDGDHLGISKFRDYVLLSMADEDTEVEAISQEDLESLSTGPSGTNHPAVFLLLPAPEDSEPLAIVQDDGEHRTGIVLTLPFEVGGKDSPEELAVQVVIQGAGPH